MTGLMHARCVVKHSNGSTIYRNTATFTQTINPTNATFVAKHLIREYASQSTFHAENTKNNSGNQVATKNTRHQHRE
ncbi:hypothetical protein OS493_009265 [Desmophyllum pertusum]|uniref:Uncharacterized protein n=1 Tax=Desmophyllum pertusum TaxID=174260 RepID=A0A9W9Z242_9CNID|nr:hypothetical protein OS493_009265 [Desmophyllum pertusum]